MRDYWTRQEVATMLGVSTKTLRRLHLSGALKSIPVTLAGRKQVYRRGDVEAYLKAREDAA